MIHICILGVDNNFDKYHISILLGSLAEILFIFQITPAAIGTIEAMFYMILKNISFDNNSIILVITQFRLSLCIIVVGLGSVFFYKFFKLSIKNVK